MKQLDNMNVVAQCFAIVLVLTALQTAVAQQKKFAGTRPNVVFILADDLGYNDLACYQNTYVQTPNIDALAAGGLKFTQAYVNAPNCAPSRACLLSGMFTPRHGVYTVGESARGNSKDQQLVPVVNETVLDTAFVTFAEGLVKTGYQCISIGKWHLGETAFGPEGQGFSRNIGGTQAGAVKSHFSPFITPLPGLGTPSAGTFLADALCDKAVDWLEAQHNSPFFLYLPFYSVHSPVQAPAALVRKYEKLLPANAGITPVYAAMIENLDSNVGRLVKKIKDLGMEENTLIVFFSDNGPVLNSTTVNLRGEKGSLYEGGIREPLIMNWKNHLAPGRVISHPVMAVDFYPTFMELAGLAKGRWPANLDGQSLLSLLGGGPGPVERTMIWHFPAYLETNNRNDKRKVWRETPSSAIRYGNWKLVIHYGSRTTELFNLDTDAKETHDLALSNPKKAAQLKGMLDAYLKKTKAFIPTALNPEYVPSDSNR